MMKSTIPFWSIDAFLYWLMPRDHLDDWSSELISRVSGFIEAYILFDTICIPERYKNSEIIRRLDSDSSIFEFIGSSQLRNSDHLSNGVTLDLSLNLTSLETLAAEDYQWFSQHQGYAPREDYDSLIKEGGISITHLRLWQFSLVNEIADLSESTVILPLSLQNIESSKTRTAPFHVQKLSDLDTYFQESVKSVSATLGPSFNDFLHNTPPFLTLLIDQAQSQDHAIDVLRQLRRDYAALKDQSKIYRDALDKTASLRDKTQIIAEWNDSWASLLKESFRKPQLLTRKISSADIAKALIKPHEDGISRILEAFLEYREECRIYSRFHIYSELYNELDGIKNAPLQLRKKFKIELSNILRR